MYKVFSIRDTKGEVFNKPYFDLTMDSGLRTFQSTVNDPHGVVTKYPEDFDLFYLGEFNEKDGKYSLLPTPEHICKAIQCVNQKMDQQELVDKLIAALKDATQQSHASAKNLQQIAMQRQNINEGSGSLPQVKSKRWFWQKANA